MVTRIRHLDPTGVTATLYQQIAREVQTPRERLRLVLERGLRVTAPDGLFWFGIQRIAADVQRLRKSGMAIATSEAEASDNLTGTTRRIPVFNR